MAANIVFEIKPDWMAHFRHKFPDKSPVQLAAIGIAMSKGAADHIMKTERFDVVLSPAGRAIIGGLRVWKTSEGGYAVTGSAESPGSGATAVGSLDEKDYVFAIEMLHGTPKR